MKNDRGATIVEYALLFTILIGALVMILGFTEDAMKEEIQTEANCVAATPGTPEAAACGYDPEHW